ncbi:hypothetical protein ACFPOU_03230 [Massilia jejuensis]|uniref:Uncharacterized protein n=1 Tax=Massilia jejuensis TaxID=648894 RepID=A0ABW0PE17_9BURK
MPGAAPPEAVPDRAAPRPWTPLALTLGLHLLPVLAWLTSMRGAAAPGPPQREAKAVFLQV